MLRYPYTFYEEVSRALIIFKTFRGNRKIFRALPIMDELIDYTNIDPISGKHLFEMTQEQRKHCTQDLIDIPVELVVHFKQLYQGTDSEYDGVLGFKHLAPGTTLDPKQPTVYIRKPISIIEAYGEHPAEWTALIADLAYQVQQLTPSGFPVTIPHPMVNWNNIEEVETMFTHQIPYVIWAQLFERVWGQLAPTCTRIERVIAAALAQKGIVEGYMSSREMPDADNDENDYDLLL